jgi:CheY-like chemotaxis protein
MTLYIKKIMIIDDDSVDRFILRRVLGTIYQAEIIECDCGSKALEKIAAIIIGKHRFPDLIFLDINMPILNGFEFLDALKQLSPENKNRSRIVLISSLKNEADEKKMLLYDNIIGYKKPVKKPALLELKKQFRYRQAS